MEIYAPEKLVIGTIATGLGIAALLAGIPGYPLLLLAYGGYMAGRGIGSW